VLKISSEVPPPPLRATAWGGGQVVDLIEEMCQRQMELVYFCDWSIMNLSEVIQRITGQVRQPGEVFQSL